MFAKFTALNAVNARRLSVAGVVATALFGLSACGTQIAAQNAAVSVPVAAKSAPAKTATAAPAPTPGAAPVSYTAGMALVSNGTAIVRIGGRAVTFPTTVTGAAWSPDGSEIAFIDANGNVATAHPDGTGLSELTAAKTGVTRANPSWFGDLVLFSETDAEGVSRIESVATGATRPSGSASFSATEQQIDGGQGFADAADGDSHPSGTPLQLSGYFGDNGSIAFQHQGSEGPEVWIVDSYSRGPAAAKLADGTDPAMSPDGTKIAYVDGTGQIEIYTDGPDSQAPTTVQVTFGAADPTNLVWSPDGSRIAFSTATDVESVAATVPAHATANPATLLSSTPGVATFLSSYKGETDQFGSTDPVDLSIAASQSRWPTQQVFGTAQNSMAIADNVTLGSSTALSADLKLLPYVHGDGPLLLTSGSTLDPRVTAELRRVFGTIGAGPMKPSVYLLGGTSDVPASVEAELQQMGYQTYRVTGTETAWQTTATVFSQPSVRAVAVDSSSPLDELIGTAYAAYYNAPIMQVSSTGGLTSAQLGWYGAAAGPAIPTAVFAPETTVFSTVGTALTAQGVDPLGYANELNPQHPVEPAN